MVIVVLVVSGLVVLLVMIDMYDVEDVYVVEEVLLFWYWIIGNLLWMVYKVIINKMW